MTSRTAGLRIALAAITVQAPRLVLVVLGADRQPVPAPTERALLAVAGVGTALVLTGGNLYLAHTVAQVKAWRRTLAAAWVLVLAASGGLGFGGSGAAETAAGGVCLEPLPAPFLSRLLPPLVSGLLRQGAKRIGWVGPRTSTRASAVSALDRWLEPMPVVWPPGKLDASGSGVGR
jgi:hypothetical protein